MERKETPLYFTWAFLTLSLKVSVLLTTFKVAFASQTLKLMLLQEASLTPEPRDVQSLNLLSTFTSSKATPVGSKKTLPYHGFLWV